VDIGKGVEPRKSQCTLFFVALFSALNLWVLFVMTDE